MAKRFVALIPAAGVGSRFGAEIPKQYTLLCGQTVLQHTVNIFAQNKRIGHIAVIVSPDDAWVDDALTLPEHASVWRVGGASRAETVANGVATLLAHNVMQDDDAVLVHDAARCCLPQSALNRLLDHADYPQGCLLAIPVADTLKQETPEHTIARTVPRQGLWQAQTPQLFPAGVLHRALSIANGHEITDEASAVEGLGWRPLLVEGDTRNLKLTRPDDALLAQFFLSQPFQE